MNKKKKTIGALVALGVLGVTALGVAGSPALAAETEEGVSNALVQAIAERFSLSTDDVQAVFDEHRPERPDHARFEDLTQDQKDVLEAKREEMKTFMESLEDVSEEERREALEGKREEMEAWAEENNIPMRGFGHFGPREGMGHPFK